LLALSAVQRYQQRISGPLLDRIDIHLEMARVPFQKLASLEAGEDSVRSGRGWRRRARCRRALSAWGKPHVLVNGDMGPAEVQAFCDIDEAGRNLMRAAMQQMNLSARAYHRILKLGRTIADLAGDRGSRCITWPRRCNTGRDGPRRARNMRKTRKKPRFRVFRSFRGYRVPNTCAPVVTYNRLIGHSCISISIMIL
jgi:hypothetical protein